MVGSRSGIRPGSVGKVLAVAVAMLLVALGGTASALMTGGAPTPAAVPLPASPVGVPAPGVPSVGTLSIVSATTSPRKSFFYGFRYPSLRFLIGSSQQQNDLRVEIVNSAGEAVKTYYRNDVTPQTATSIRWDGTTGAGKPAPNGHYSFRIAGQGAMASVARSAGAGAPLSLGFDLYGYAFPVLGPHNFGDAADRFGAPRDGHTHQGQDTMAACGTPLVAARGGAVQYSGFEGSAGNYIVIDGKGTPLDFMYAHLAQPSPLKTGDTVRTGQLIGIVGDTGDATACHLHFEIWTAPGWYQGGHPIDPLPYLKKWDAYS